MEKRRSRIDGAGIDKLPNFLPHEMENMKTLRNVIAPLLIVMMVLLSGTSRAVNTITVTDPGDIGPGTLRDAIAGALPGATINFAAGLDTITLTSGALVIDKDLTISGP